MRKIVDAGIAAEASLCGEGIKRQTAQFLERLTQQATAAADIQHPGRIDLTTVGHEAHAHRVDQMQRSEFPRGVPESMRNGVEFANFGAVRVARRTRFAARYAHGCKLLSKWGEGGRIMLKFRLCAGLKAFGLNDRIRT